MAIEEVPNYTKYDIVSINIFNHYDYHFIIIIVINQLAKEGTGGHRRSPQLHGSLRSHPQSD